MHMVRLHPLHLKSWLIDGKREDSARLAPTDNLEVTLFSGLYLVAKLYC